MRNARTLAHLASLPSVAKVCNGWTLASDVGHAVADRVPVRVKLVGFEFLKPIAEMRNESGFVYRKKEAEALTDGSDIVTVGGALQNSRTSWPGPPEDHWAPRKLDVG